MFYSKTCSLELVKFTREMNTPVIALYFSPTRKKKSKIAKINEDVVNTVRRLCKVAYSDSLGGKPFYC